MGVAPAEAGVESLFGYGWVLTIFRGNFERQLQWKSSQLADINVITHFVWKEKWLKVRIYMNSWAVANGLASWSVS